MSCVLNRRGLERASLAAKFRVLIFPHSLSIFFLPLLLCEWSMNNFVVLSVPPLIHSLLPGILVYLWAGWRSLFSLKKLFFFFFNKFSFLLFPFLVFSFSFFFFGHGRLKPPKGEKGNKTRKGNSRKNKVTPTGTMTMHISSNNPVRVWHPVNIENKRIMGVQISSSEKGQYIRIARFKLYGISSVPFVFSSWSSR